MDARTERRLDVLQAWLLLLPPLALALPSPWSLFTGAPDVISIGAGLCALGVLPALLVSALRAFLSRDDEERAAAIPMGAPLLLAPLGLAAYHLERATDSFNAWRALVGLAGATGAYMAASSLGEAGRRVLQRGLPIVTLMLLVSIFLEPGLDGALEVTVQGAIGNTGDLAEAALPGAILGAGAFLATGGPLALLGLLALFGAALHAGLVPVYAGAAAMGAAVIAAFAASAIGRGDAGGAAAARRARLLLVAVLVAALGTVGRQAFSGSDGEPESTPPTIEEADEGSTPPSIGETTGGFTFRRLTWARVPDALADTGVDGAGPGQFQAIFPPYRDPAEIELSSRYRAEPTPVEVEHAHNDALTALVEYGWLGGGAFVLLLVLTVARALGAIAGPEDARRDFALVALAMVAMALLNAPLLYAPLSHFLAFMAFGVVAAPALDAPRENGNAGFTAHAVVLLAAALVAPRSLDLVRYGRAMAEIPATFERLGDRERNDPEKLVAALDGALRHAPDACWALEKKAQLMRATGAPLVDQLEIHTEFLERRPKSVAGLINIGLVLAMGSSFEAARERTEEARRLDPGNPTVLRNLVRVTFDLRDADAFEGALSRASEAGALEEGIVRKYAYEALIGCRIEVAAPAVRAHREAGGEAPLDARDENQLFGAAEAARADGDDEMRAAYRTAFDFLVALDHLNSGSFGNAVTKARQAYQRARDAGVDTGPARLRLAAAHVAAGDAAEAERVLGLGPVRRRDGDFLSPIEVEALTGAGLLKSASASNLVPR